MTRSEGSDDWLLFVLRENMPHLLLWDRIDQISRNKHMNLYVVNKFMDQHSVIRILYFLVLCRLMDLIQDIGVYEFDSSAFIKAYIVGISV